MIDLKLEEASILDIASMYGCKIVRDYKFSHDNLIFDSMAKRFYRYDRGNWYLVTDPRPIAKS